MSAELPFDLKIKRESKPVTIVHEESYQYFQTALRKLTKYLCRRSVVSITNSYLSAVRTNQGLGVVVIVYNTHHISHPVYTDRAEVVHL